MLREVGADVTTASFIKVSLVAWLLAGSKVAAGRCGGRSRLYAIGSCLGALNEGMLVEE